jgi:hypothetical protein
VVVADAMVHPAKFSSRLIRRIYEHMLEEGWVRAGDAVVDPFGGVALGALEAMRHGLHWTGVELEERFWKIGNDNISLWMGKYGGMRNWGTAQLVHGDSRELRKVIRDQVQGVVSSPPYAETPVNQTHMGSNKRRDRNPNYRPSWERKLKEGVEKTERPYGETDGQLGAMPADGFELAVSSPPYVAMQVEKNAKSIDRSKQYEAYKKSGGGQTFEQFCRTQDIHSQGYGESDGQLSSMRGGDSGDDFWLAARVIVEQVHQSLAPGGHACWVVKDYVKSKQIVPFSDRWRQLCEAVGFETLHEHRAMLVHHKGRQGMLDGGVHEIKTESKSFFRRLAEKKGSPRIDWEVVWCMRKP